MTKIRKLSSNIYAVSDGKNGAVVTFGNADASYSSKSAGARGAFVPWGEKNDQLQRMHQLASESPNKWRLMKTRRDFVVGRGVYTHNEAKAPNGSDTVFVPKKYDSFEAWRKLSGFDRVWIRKNMHYAFCGNAFVKLVFGTDKKVGSLDTIDPFKIRPKKPEAGDTRISAYILNPNMGTKNYKAKDDVTLPAYDPANPTKFPVCILHLKDDMPGQDYFSFPEWWSTEKWTKVANKIPDFHDAGLDNGYNIKYHISIPDNYFDRDEQTEEQKEELKRETLMAMTDTLAGIQGADKALVTFHNVDVNGKEITGVKIEPLKNFMSDDAYTTLFNTANLAQATGHGLLPALAGIDTGGKLGGSGKELEAAANYQQNFLTYVDRFILLEPLRLVQTLNGWEEDMCFDVRNTQLYNYDVTPSGASTNPTNPTSTNAD